MIVDEYEVRALLKRLNWEVLVTKRPDFIIGVVLKKVASSGIRFERDAKNKIVVVPVTMFGHDDPIARSSDYVYEQYRGWFGEVLRERNNGAVDLCMVRIRKSEISSPVVTEILKSDLSYE